ncbi:MAG: GNAT family N-acetyltransferase [Jhaorihella sp.]
MIRLATAADSAVIAQMLARLADEIGDGARFASTAETIRAHGFGEQPFFSALLAGDKADPRGLALFTRHFSTARGMPGVFLLDLWVALAMRGRGLGERLVRAVARHGATAWQAGYLALTVYRDNPDAARFYARIGFDTRDNDIALSLAGSGFRDMIGQAEDAT